MMLMYSLTLNELERVRDYVPIQEQEILHKLDVEISYLHSIDTRGKVEQERREKMHNCFDKIEQLYGYTRENLCKKDNHREISIVRQCVMTIAMQNGYSLREAGEFVNRDHSTAYYSKTSIHSNLYGFNKEYTDIFNSINC